MSRGGRTTVVFLIDNRDSLRFRAGGGPWGSRPRLVKRKRKSVGSDKTVFALKQGDELPPEKAPRVKKRAIHITALVEDAE